MLEIRHLILATPPETATTCTVNGQPQTVNAPVGTTLLSWLREEVGLTGTKEGCGRGDCGACTVLLDRQAVNSCLVLAAEVDGATIETVEGLAEKDDDGELTLHPLQQSFIECGAVQCGFCTSGMLMTAAALLENTPGPLDRPTIKRAIGGNICRCTGYQKIVDAIAQTANQRPNL